MLIPLFIYLFFRPFLSSPPHYKRLRYRDKKFRLEARQDVYAFYLLLLDKSDDNLVTSVKSKKIFSIIFFSLVTDLLEPNAGKRDFSL